MSRVIEAFAQFFDGNGDPLVDGWLRFLESGSNNTDKDTYSDVNESIANTNPVQLDAEGRCPNVYGEGEYRVVSYTNDVVSDVPAEQIQLFDPVPGAGLIGAEFGEWSAVLAYPLGSLVTYDGEYFVSLSANNLGNVTSDEQFWQQVDFVYKYNANAAYSQNQVVQFTDSSMYVVLSDTTAGQSPTTHPALWGPSVTVFKGVEEIAKDYGTLTGGTVDFDLAVSNVGYAVISTAAQTLSFSNVGTNSTKFELHITDGGSQIISYPADSMFVEGVPPILTSSGTDVLIFEFLGDATAPVVYVAAQNVLEVP